MRRWFHAAALTAFVVFAFIGVAAAQGAAAGVEVSVLTHFTGAGPAAVAATNTGDVVALVGTNVVRIGPDGKQTPLPTTISGGAFGIPIGIAYDSSHQLYAALPGAFAPPPSGPAGVLKLSSNGKTTTSVAGSEGMVAADGFGLDSATGDLYVTDIFGHGIWRIGADGSAHLWTSGATNPLLVLPDGVKVFQNAVYVSLEAGKILRIPINADGSAGTASVWAHIDEPGVFFDDMTLDDRTGDVYVARIDTSELLQITPGGAITAIATHADGLLGAANMTLIHSGQDTVIYIANGESCAFVPGCTTTGGAGLAILKITIPSPTH
jgi:sugar lactone lactonase YvrE